MFDDFPWSGGDVYDAADLNSLIERLFAGDGAQGAFSESSGNTNYDMSSARYYVRAFSSFSLTGSADISFTNPHNDGTSILFLVAGDFTHTSSAQIDITDLGGAGSGGSSGQSNRDSFTGVNRGAGMFGAPAHGMGQFHDVHGPGGAGGGSMHEEGADGGNGSGGYGVSNYPFKLNRGS